MSVRVRSRLGRRHRLEPTPVCNAPFTTLFLDQSGDVHACCFSRGYPLGRIGEQRLPEIWAGARARALRAAVGAGDLSLGCEVCAWNTSVGNPVDSTEYDRFVPTSTEPAYPKLIIFAISSACNLQCVMCDGFISSSIRLHREKLPPLPDRYDEQFFADVADFLPHLEEASFMGGEPFMVRGNHRIWDLMIDRTPDTPIAITTNLTQWNPRVERVLAELDVFVNVSIDGFTKDTFESIRVGADHDTVLTNLERFRRAPNRGMQLLHCLMPQNHHEFVDLLLFAEQRDLPVGVNVITRGRPEDCIERLPEAELREIRDGFARRADEVLDRLPLNGPVLLAQIERIDRWLARDEEPLALAIATSPELPHSTRTHVLDVARVGGPSDDERARRTVAAFAREGGTASVRVGSDDTITGVSASLTTLLGVSPDELVGRPADAVRAALVGAYGEVRSMRTVREDDDEVERIMEFGDTEILAVTVAIRPDGGSADEARIHFGVASGRR